LRIAVEAAIRKPRSTGRETRSPTALALALGLSNSYSNRFSHASQLMFLKNASTYFARSVAR
jgi:hypothetical protein